LVFEYKRVTYSTVHESLRQPRRTISMTDFIARLRTADVFPKLNDAFSTRTSSGGVITLASSIVMILLFTAEIRLLFVPHTSNNLNVDTSRGAKLQINLDVTFHHMGCATISLDAMDVSGDNHLDVITNIFRRRLGPDGKPKIDDVAEKETKLGGSNLVVIPSANGSDILNISHPDACGSCYGAEEKQDECCNTCNDVREAYRRRGWAFGNIDHVAQCKNERATEKISEQKGEGCNIYGHLEVNKVAGNFHFAPGKSFQQGNMHVHDLMPFENMDFNVSHTIHKMSFGADFPGVQNPMDGVARIMRPQDGQGMYQYFVKVVPTLYRTARGHEIDTNQFSVTEHYKKSEGAMRGLPGVFVFYDLSPIKVHFTEERRSFLQFLTSVCAIIGGVFTVSGLIDSFVYHGQKAIKQKMEIGKLT